jgi:hypothetical protein
MKMERTECSETSPFNIQTPGKYPDDNIPLNMVAEFVSNFVPLSHEDLKVTIPFSISPCLQLWHRATFSAPMSDNKGLQFWFIFKDTVTFGRQAERKKWWHSGDLFNKWGTKNGRVTTWLITRHVAWGGKNSGKQSEPVANFAASSPLGYTSFRL